MDNLRAQILESIEHIEKTPLMFCSSSTFFSLSDFIFGLFEGVQFCEGVDLNLQFSKWLSKKHTQTSLVWWGYIWHVMADKEEKIALELLFIELKDFLRTE